jgi:hypothetical protein
MEFYSADIEMLMSGWNTLYILDEDADSIFWCSCEMMTHTGHPCINQLSMLREHCQQLCRKSFNERRFALRQKAQLDDKILNDGLAFDDDLKESRERAETEWSRLEVHGWGSGETLRQSPRMSQHNIHLTLLHFSKSLCEVAARSLEQTRQTLADMYQLHRRLLTDRPSVAPLPEQINSPVEVLDDDASVP